MAANRTILIVDDDPTLVASISRMLRVGGYAVLTATDAKAGLQQLIDASPDAVIVDLRMPVLDGLVFMRQLRSLESPRQTPVAVMTGDYLVDETVINELQALGATVYFKPLWLDDVLGIAQRLVSD